MRFQNSSKTGFSLVEVTLALGLVGFALVTLLGVFVIGISTERDSVEQIRAANLATRLISERRNNPLEGNSNVFVLPPLNDTSLLSNPRTFYFSESEGLLPSVSRAAVACQVESHLSRDSAIAYLTLDFYWPAQTATNTGARPNYRVTTAIPLTQ
ncbi:MAG: hypothetical protein AAF558_13845 [Verrucomicrobiota bacterium]